MNWIRIDYDTEAREVAGAGCFVRFGLARGVCFAPNVSIHKATDGKFYLVAAVPTYIRCTTSGTGSATVKQLHDTYISFGEAFAEAEYVRAKKSAKDKLRQNRKGADGRRRR
jgi:hypothetical protein